MCVVFWCLVAEVGFVGLQVLFVLCSFYDGFLFGRGWVDLLLFYNEYLISDVGGFNLVFVVLFVWVALRFLC